MHSFRCVFCSLLLFMFFLPCPWIYYGCCCWFSVLSPAFKTHANFCWLLISCEICLFAFIFVMTDIICHDEFIYVCSLFRVSTPFYPSSPPLLSQLCLSLCLCLLHRMPGISMEVSEWINIFHPLNLRNPSKSLHISYNMDRLRCCCYSSLCASLLKAIFL